MPFWGVLDLLKLELGAGNEEMDNQCLFWSKRQSSFNSRLARAPQCHLIYTHVASQSIVRNRTRTRNEQELKIKLEDELQNPLRRCGSLRQLDGLL